MRALSRALGGALVIVLSASACSKFGSEDRAEAASKSAVPTSATADAAMCAIHGVQKSLCTKCNPRLVPVFQAKGDWCKEHEFPESFCPICHPERGGRPLMDTSAEAAPADGTKIRLKRPGTSATAGIETARAQVREGRGGVPAVVRLAYDATKLARLNPRAPGVVRDVKADVGVRVKKGQLLVVIDSPEIGADRARLEAARSAVEAAKTNHVRAEQMALEGVGSQKSVLDAKQDLAAATAEYAAIEASLRALGAGTKGASGYGLTAPLAGVVTERTATIGKQVSAEEVLFEIVDTSSLWADLEVPETELGLVAVGQAVSLSLEALPGRTFQGKIDFVAPAIDPHTRTARARVSLPNPDGVLRAQMFGEAHIDVGAARRVVSIPRAAVQRVKDVSLAFVRVSAEEYETRRIELGVFLGDQVEVTRGLAAGDEVVTTGSFLLKTETLKGSIGAGCCEGE